MLTAHETAGALPRWVATGAVVLRWRAAARVRPWAIVDILSAVGVYHLVFPAATTMRYHLTH
jgi:hypothetical protein